MRGSFDHNAPYQPLRRWTQAPRIFFLTRTGDAGDPVPDAVIDVMQEMAARPFFHEMFHALGYYHTHEGFSVDNQ